MKKKVENIGIYVGVEKETVKAAGEQIINILEYGYEYSMDQETVRTALCQFSEAVSINGTSIMNNSVNMDSGDKE